MVNATLSAPLDSPVYSGAATTSDQVPGLFEVALNGREFQVQRDPAQIEVWGQHYRRVSIQNTRDQADQSDEPGEQSISPEQFWRRSQQSWHKGAGQAWLDWPGSDRDRFRSSKGVDVWTQKQIGLLHDTIESYATTNTGLRIVKAGVRVYLADGNALKYSTDATTFTSVTGTPTVKCESVATDGFDVWAAYGAAGLYQTNTGSAAASSYVTGSVDLVGYVKGRLMAAAGPRLYNITTSGALPDPLFTHSASAWVWSGFANAPGFIYAAGFAGGHSEIYAITIADTGATLDPPTIAAELPEGEVVRCIYGYAGFLLIGTDRGLRVAAVNNDGSLVVGALISQPGPVRCFDGQDKFVWFGWSNFDATSTGLGRVDLSVFTSALVPAFASDLMAAAQGAVTGTLQLSPSKRIFAVNGKGVYTETTTPVASGTLSSGYIGYDLADEKQAVFLDLRHDPLPLGASVAASVAVDAGDFIGGGTSSSAGSTSPTAFFLNGRAGERFEVKLTLTAGTGSPPSPQVTRYTLRADVRPQPTSQFTVPLIITDTYLIADTEIHRSAAEDVEWLIDLHQGGVIFPYQEGSRTYLVKMTDFEWVLDQASADVPGDSNGTFIVQLRHITG